MLIDVLCPGCGASHVDVFIDSGAPVYPHCACGTVMERRWSASHALRPDTIPGGVWIAHGLCHVDGTPRRYDSRSEIAEECRVRNLVPWTDVYTEDRTKDARVKADWQQSGEAKRAKHLRDEARRERRR